MEDGFQPLSLFLYVLALVLAKCSDPGMVALLGGEGAGEHRSLRKLMLAQVRSFTRSLRPWFRCNDYTFVLNSNAHKYKAGVCLESSY